ncbi:MAG: histidinol dehydrogenase, partial [Propionibacterium sp.]|nr:histidinol dehydrogenase [Propionibacterium sp.]
MLRNIDLRGRLAAGETLNYPTLVPRAETDVEAAVAVVAPICAAVATEGEAALRRFSEQFDDVVPEHFRVPAAAIAEAVAGLDPQVRAAFEVAIERRRTVAEAERGSERVEVDLAPGARVIQKMIPVNRVGLYVPGGLEPLASSVLMNVIPAQVAGVGSIAVSSPPQAEFGGLPHPSILAVCGLLGVEEVYGVGGAQAIAMFAHGVPGLCPKVDVVTGPGNIYVVAAKRLLRGLIGIDAEAGPTEVAIIADDTAVPAHVAADLLSQAEHDPMAGSVLITASADLAAAVDAEVAELLTGQTHEDRMRTALTGTQSGIVLVDDLDQAVAVADAYGAEHLEIHTADAMAVAERITNAGAIFVGSFAPVSLGDYSAG